MRVILTGNICSVKEQEKILKHYDNYNDYNFVITRNFII